MAQQRHSIFERFLDFLAWCVGHGNGGRNSPAVIVDTKTRVPSIYLSDGVLKPSWIYANLVATEIVRFPQSIYQEDIGEHHWLKWENDDVRVTLHEHISRNHGEARHMFGENLQVERSLTCEVKRESNLEEGFSFQEGPETAVIEKAMLLAWQTKKEWDYQAKEVKRQHAACNLIESRMVRQNVPHVAKAQFETVSLTIRAQKINFLVDKQRVRNAAFRETNTPENWNIAKAQANEIKRQESDLERGRASVGEIIAERFRMLTDDNYEVQLRQRAMFHDEELALKEQKKRCAEWCKVKNRWGDWANSNWGSPR